MAEGEYYQYSLIMSNNFFYRSEVINANKLAESVAQAFCVALIDYLDQLYENGLTKISLRISLDIDKVLFIDFDIDQIIILSIIHFN